MGWYDNIMMLDLYRYILYLHCMTIGFIETLPFEIVILHAGDDVTLVVMSVLGSLATSFITECRKHPHKHTQRFVYCVFRLFVGLLQIHFQISLFNIKTQIP